MWARSHPVEGIGRVAGVLPYPTMPQTDPASDPSSEPPRHRITLNRPHWELLAKREHLLTIKDKADFIGMTRYQVAMIQSGARPVGTNFIAAALAAFDCTFEDLFLVDATAPSVW